MAELCAGCGDDLSARQSDRRSLGSAGAVKVLHAWREFLKKLGRGDREEELVGSGNVVMCRKCYSSYERYQKLQREIESKLQCTLSATEHQHPASKRPRLDPQVSPTRFRHKDNPIRLRHNYTPSSSPSVRVSLLPTSFQ